ncbi:phage minor head protein [Methylobacterium sp. CM6247]
MSDPIVMLADEIELEIETAFLDAIEDISTNMDVPSLIGAIERGDEEVLGAYVADRLRPVQDIFARAFAQSGILAADRLGLTFDPMASTAVAARSSAVAGFMRSIVSDTAKAMAQAAFRTTMLSAAIAGTVLIGGVPAQAGDKAILVREIIGLSPTQGANLTAFRAALENTMARQPQPLSRIGFRRELLVVAELPAHVLRYLNASQRSVIEAASGTLDQNQVDALVAHQRRTLLKVRAGSIATSGAVTATNAGEHSSWRQAVENRDLGSEWRRYWHDVGDEKVRHAHREVSALNPNGVGIDEPFVTSFGPRLHPPLEINCRCRVELRQGLN